MAILDKDKRQEKKAERQQKRDDKLESKVTSDASKYGIDLDDLPKGPVTAQDKERITQGVKESTSKDLAADIDKFAKSYADPTFTDRPTLDKEALKADYKRQRKLRWTDALTALGRGMQGKSVDPESFQSAKMQKEREAQFKQYKDVVGANRATSEKWQHQYRNDLIDFLDSKIKDQNTSVREKEKMNLLKAQVQKAQSDAERIKADAERIKADAERIKADAAKKGRSDQEFQLGEDEHRMEGPTPYTKLLQSLDADITSLIPPKTDGKTYNLESEASQIIMQMYDKKYDAKGKAYLTPKEGAEGYLDTARENARKAAEIAPIDQELQLAKMELEDMGDEGTGALEWIDRKKRRELEETIATLEQQKANILNAGPSTAPQENNTQIESEQSESALDDIYNS